MIRLLGLHSVVISNDVEIYFVVMENIFNTNLKIDEKFDVKVEIKTCFLLIFFKGELGWSI